jgi:hypothetical protein
MNGDMTGVLTHLAGHFSRPEAQQLNTPFDVPGMDFDSQVAPALRRLADAEPPFIKSETRFSAKHPVAVWDLTERGWEIAEAAGDALDASPGQPADQPTGVALGPGDRQFQVALSFAGEQRDYVQGVANALKTRGINNFYDEEQQSHLWGKNLRDELQRIYQDGSHAVVMFISQEYAAKPWTSHERKSALSRALRERTEYVLPVRFDDTELPGLDRDLGYLQADQHTPEQLAEKIADKLVALGITVPAMSGPAAGWSREESGRSTSAMTVTVLDDGDDPMPGATVCAVAANGTYVDAQTDDAGTAVLQLPNRRLITLYAAGKDCAPAVVQGHDPVDDLRVTLPRAEAVDGYIFTAGIGHVEGIQGRLNVLRDAPSGTPRYYLYADNVAVNDQPDQPVHFELGQPMALEDANGARAELTVLEVIGRSCLLRIRR